MMAATRRIDSEEFTAATTLAREVRENVAEQLRALVVEADRMAGRGDVAQRIQRIIHAETRIAQAKAKQAQARQLGLALAPAVQQERDARDLLRESLMQCALACAGWVAQMDYHVERARKEDVASG